MKTSLLILLLSLGAVRAHDHIEVGVDPRDPHRLGLDGPAYQLALYVPRGEPFSDIHFSQFYMSPLNLNPAMTGVMNCNTRMVANYRNQWASILRSNAFRTYSVSYDQRIPSGRYDFFGVGGTFWGDRAGEANFSTMTGKVSLSYSKRMGGYRKKANYLVVGAEGGAAQRSIDFLNLRWGTQHDGQGGFDPTLDP